MVFQLYLKLGSGCKFKNITPKFGVSFMKTFKLKYFIVMMVYLFVSTTQSNLDWKHWGLKYLIDLV